ncbi:MAG: Holliday junction resolvase [Thermoprotei archaeon]|nr:MAG: Holliday junction resolvase [Thermoprotei archaeon]RLF17048.1 MAG: Holliday junction resolvase [Thermoprotei archaeon]
MAFRKGYRAEVELMENLRKEGFYVVRIPISGGRGLPCDILAAKGEDRRGYQVKETKANRIYLSEGEVKALLEFCQAFGLKPFIAVKWKFRRQNPWTVIEVKGAKRLKIEYSLPS